jgi:hypothetical protein
VQKAYDLAKEVLPRVSKFPRDYKFTLGDRIVGNTLDILESLIQAAYSKEKTSLLAKADVHLERVRFLLRLSCDLGPLSQPGYEHVMGLITELGKQIGGWSKQAGASHG